MDHNGEMEKTRLSSLNLPAVIALSTLICSGHQMKRIGSVLIVIVNLFYAPIPT